MVSPSFVAKSAFFGRAEAASYGELAVADSDETVMVAVDWAKPEGV
jgi:hypothetical protein